MYVFIYCLNSRPAEEIGVSQQLRRWFTIKMKSSQRTVLRFISSAGCFPKGPVSKSQTGNNSRFQPLPK